ncbi:hypothetical protein [Selenomonas sp. TAMA-11512]|uniref:hypothetical protein n=1 Tax=Selenomonas sp. TAMA-11512 TaxID=3095337 RepID=UPI0030D4251E
MSKNILYKIVKKIVNLFRLSDYADDEKQFIEFNKKDWEMPSEDCEGVIYIYAGGTLAYQVIGAAIVGKAMERMYKKRPIVLLAGPEKDSRTKAAIYHSFGIQDFINFRKFKPSTICKVLRQLLRFRATCSTGEDILNFEFMGRKMGHYLYDGILRCYEGKYTIRRRNELRLFDYMKMAEWFLTAYQLDECFKTYRIKELIYVDWDHMPQSAAEFIARKYEAILYVVCEGFVIKQDAGKSEGYRIIKSFEPIQREFWAWVDTLSDMEEIQNYTEQRQKGIAPKQMDIDAYKDKPVLSKEEIYALFGIKNDKKNVVIAAHSFADLPHWYKGVIYRDFYDWLEKTIEILNENDKVNVFLKAHPSRWLYGEENAVNELLERVAHQHIYVLPDYISTASVAETMDYVVTCNGTMGLEMAGFGIPVFTAAEGYWTGYGIEISSGTAEEYREHLMHIDSYERLDKETQKTARLLLYYIWNQNLYRWTLCNDIIDFADGINYPAENQYAVFNEGFKQGRSFREPKYENCLEDMRER